MNYLPGHPKPKLVKEVRSHLRHFGIAPKRDALWQLTWRWASDIANSYYYTSWPMASEIASQYVLLLLADMRAARSLRLPHRAAKKMPAAVAEILGATPSIGGNPELLAIAVESAGAA